MNFTLNFVPRKDDDDEKETCNKNWAEKFIVPTRFSKETRDAMKNKVITKKVRDEVINALSTLILVHTIKPNPRECEIVCRKLITEYPILRDSKSVHTNEGYVSLKTYF